MIGLVFICRANSPFGFFSSSNVFKLPDITVAEDPDCARENPLGK